MALKNKILLESGLEITESYIKINTYCGTKNNIDICTTCFVNEELYKAEKLPILTKYYSFIPSVSNDSSNFIKQGYEYLKTLDEFKSAIDC